MEYYDRPVSRARGRLVASRQAFFEQVASPQPSSRNDVQNLTNLVDEKLEKFTRSTQEATRNLAKSTPDLTALEQDANIQVSQHLSKSRGNLNQTFDSSLSSPYRTNFGNLQLEVDGGGLVSVNKSFNSYLTHKKPPLPPKKPSSPPPPAPICQRPLNDMKDRTPIAYNRSPPQVVSAVKKESEFDRIVNSIKSTDTYRRYKNHPSLVQPPDMRRRSKSLGFLELDEDDNWVLPQTKVTVEPVFPELSERSASTVHLVKKKSGSLGNGSSDGHGSATTDDEDDDIPIPCNRLTAAKSEYELRVEKSLKNLNLPDWYTKSSRPSSRASILSGRGTPAMSSERFTRNRPDYESFRSVHSMSSNAPKRDSAGLTRTTTPSWRSFSSTRRSTPPRTPSSEAEHETMEKTQNWINSQHSSSTPTYGTPASQYSSSRLQAASTPTSAKEPPYTGWRRTRESGGEPRAFDRRQKDFAQGSESEYSSSFEEKRYGSERYSFVQAVNNSVLSEDQRSYLETSFDSNALPTRDLYHNKVWIESSLISRPGGFQKTAFEETSYRQESFPNAYGDSFGVYEKRESRHPDMIYGGGAKQEAPSRPTGRHGFPGGLLEAVV